MKVISKGISVSVTEAIEAQIQEHFGTILDNFEEHIVENIQVTIESNASQSTSKNSVKARIPVKGNDIFADATGDDMYSALTEAAASATRQLRKLKGKGNHKGAETIRSHVDESDEEENAAA
jgi:putative sigma-54 modulation protein